MKFLSEYAISILVVSVLAILFENILPADHNKKYCNIIIGLFVMLVILTPLTHLPHYDETFRLPALHLNDADFSPEVKPYVTENFEKNLALSIVADLRQTFGTTVACQVVTNTNDAGQITGISHVILSPHTPETAAYIAQKYGLEEAIITP